MIEGMTIWPNLEFYWPEPEPTCHLPHWINPDTGVCEHTDHDSEDDNDEQ